MSVTTEKRNSLPTFKSGLLITGGSLIGAGALIALAGLAVGGTHVVSATRRWILEMDVPPSELAKRAMVTPPCSGSYADTNTMPLTDATSPGLRGARILGPRLSTVSA